MLTERKGTDLAFKSFTNHHLYHYFYTTFFLSLFLFCEVCSGDLFLFDILSQIHFHKKELLLF